MSKLWVLNFAYGNNSKTFVYDTEFLLLEQLHILFLGICNSILEEPQELVSTYSETKQRGYEAEEDRFAHWEITDKLKWFIFESDDIDDGMNDILGNAIDWIPDQDLVIFRLLPQVKEMYTEAIKDRRVYYFSDVNLQKIDSCVFENKVLYENYFLNSIRKVRDELEEKLKTGNLSIPKQEFSSLYSLSNDLFSYISKKIGLKQIRMKISYAINEVSGEINEAVSV